MLSRVDYSSFGHKMSINYAKFMTNKDIMSDQFYYVFVFIGQAMTPQSISLQPSDSDQNTVGQRQDVICSISVPPDVDPDTIELGWLNEDDIITDDGRVTIVRSSNGSSNVSTSVITTIIQFNPLFEDDEDAYTCYSRVNESIKFASINLHNFISE